MLRNASIIIAVTIVQFCAQISPGLAQETEARAYTLPNTQVIPLTSQTSGVNYELYAKLPKGYGETDKRYPVMVTLDADYQFAIASMHVEHLTDRGQAPEMIIVSIGYDYDPTDKRAYRINRARDYTPAHTLKGGYGPQIQKYSGGGEKFAEFIRTQVLTLLDQQFRTDPEERLYIGHSFGGLFGAYLLQDHPDLFNRYILVSPSLWYNEHMMVTEAANNPPNMPRKTYVYMGVGEWENQRGIYMMVDDLKTYAALLSEREDPNLITKMRVFED